jgi:hypothetical protein
MLQYTCVGNLNKETVGPKAASVYITVFVVVEEDYKMEGNSRRRSKLVSSSGTLYE